MTARMIEIGSRPAPKPEIEVIPDLEALLGPEKCSCSASDDQPY
ncbi:hypothetical protein SAMN05421811_10325 [Nonomuraea wenchangensis]|uniref:Uncharacterized protein n=1 Tax=Nonomuraea wenchangensis TaxID=568860 RepID=A0A1I0EEY5_9ACTN|nr:hypothetical protein SAMN05421811_10325 [Nonomuraea wenchangensis]